MAVGLTGHWKAPLGYFLIACINSTVQAQLLRTALSKLHEIGIRGMAVVMDCHATNQAMVKQLGDYYSSSMLPALTLCTRRCGHILMSFLSKRTIFPVVEVIFAQSELSE